MKIHAFLFASLLIEAYAGSIHLPAVKHQHGLIDVEQPQKVDKVIVGEAKNNLRTVNGIPVAITEQQKLKNSDDNVPNINESITAKRAESDLTNPDPSEQQVDQIQNPDSTKTLIDMKDKIEETKRIFNEQFRSLSTKFDTLIHSNKNLPALRQDIHHMDSSFSNQIAELSDTIQTYIDTRSDNMKSLKSDYLNRNIEIIQSNLKKVQINFKRGITVLSESAELLASSREDDEAIKSKSDSDSSPTSSTITNNQNVNQNQNIAQYFINIIPSSIMNHMNTMSNVTNNILQIHQSNIISSMQPWFKPITQNMPNNILGNISPTASKTRKSEEVQNNVKSDVRSDNTQVDKKIENGAALVEKFENQQV